MTQPGIQPSTVTKPIQLLAAWLAGLILVDGAFLTAASQISDPSWVPGALVIASISNVPVFLIFLFYLQTRFRPEMQEDSYYFKYLERKVSAQTDKVELVEYKPPEVGHRLLDKLRTTRRVNPRKSALPNEYELIINDLLPEFTNIVLELTNAGIVIQETFGSTSEPVRVPDQFCLTFGSRVHLTTLQAVFRICYEHGLDTFGYSSSEDDDDGDVDIYVGSLLYRKHGVRLVAARPELKSELLSDDLTFDKLRELIKENRHASDEPTTS